MRYLLFSDIHSNWEAFSVLLDFLEKEKFDKLIFLGDAVGYGADPDKVVKELSQLNISKCAGNHDWAAVDKFSLEYFNPIAKYAIEWTKKSISSFTFNFLFSLPLKHEEKDFFCVHGSIFKPDKFYYITNIEEAHLNFSLLEKNICFVGHTHRPGVYIKKEDKIFFSRNEELILNSKFRYIINVGSIGQPRDGDPRICFCIYDEDKKKITYKRLEYDIIKAQRKIIERGLPPFLAYRLGKGV